MKTTKYWNLLPGGWTGLSACLMALAAMTVAGFADNPTVPPTLRIFAKPLVVNDDDENANGKYDFEEIVEMPKNEQPSLVEVEIWLEYNDDPRLIWEPGMVEVAAADETKVRLWADAGKKTQLKGPFSMGPANPNMKVWAEGLAHSFKPTDIVINASWKWKTFHSDATTVTGVWQGDAVVDSQNIHGVDAAPVPPLAGELKEEADKTDRMEAAANHPGKYIFPSAGGSEKWIPVTLRLPAPFAPGVQARPITFKIEHGAGIRVWQVPANPGSAVKLLTVNDPNGAPETFTTGRWDLLEPTTNAPSAPGISTVTLYMDCFDPAQLGTRVITFSAEQDTGLPNREGTGTCVAHVEDRFCVTPFPLAVDLRQSSGAAPTQDDDIVVVSKGADLGLASELALTLPQNFAGGPIVAKVRMKGADGDLKFSANEVAVAPGTPALIKVWGVKPSSAENKSTIEIEVVLPDGTKTTLEENLTIIEGVKLTFKGTFYVPVDVRDYRRRPTDGVTPYNPGHYSYAIPGSAVVFPDDQIAYPGILAEDTGDFSSRLVFCDGDQGVKKRTWSPPVRVTIEKIEALAPKSFVLKSDPLLLGEVHSQGGRFVEIKPGGGNDLIEGLALELRSAGKPAAICSFSTTLANNIKSAKGGVPRAPADIRKELAAALKTPGQSILASWIKDTFASVANPDGLLNYANTISGLSGIGVEWENLKYSTTRGAALEGSSAAKAFVAWQEQQGIEAIRVFFEMRNYYEWELVGGIENGVIETK